MQVQEVIQQRNKTYGGFEEVSKAFIDILHALQSNQKQDLPPPHRTSLIMISQKLARICTGDINYKDNWVDIAGYSQLVVDYLEKKEK